jgi:hypothetical protein
MASRGADPRTIMTGAFPVFDEPVAEIAAAPGSSSLAARLQGALTSERLNRAVNFTLAFVALLVLAPLLLLIAFAVKMTSRGPIIYRQTRVGYDRRRSGGDRRGIGERRALRAVPAGPRAPLAAAGPMRDARQATNFRTAGGRARHVPAYR